MHELSLVADLFTIIEQQAYQAGARKVTKVVVSVGELSGVVPELFRSAFQSYKREQLPIKPGCSLKWLKSNLNVGAAVRKLQPEISWTNLFLMSARPAVQKRWSSLPGVTFTWKNSK